MPQTCFGCSVQANPDAASVPFTAHTFLLFVFSCHSIMGVRRSSSTYRICTHAQLRVISNFDPLTCTAADLPKLRFLLEHPTVLVQRFRVAAMEDDPWAISDDSEGDDPRGGHGPGLGRGHAAVRRGDIHRVPGHAAPGVGKVRPRGRPHKDRAAAAAAPTVSALNTFLRGGIGTEAQIAFVKACARPIEPTPEVRTLTSWCLAAEARQFCSQAAEAKLLGISPKTLPQKIMDLGAAIHFASRAFGTSLLSHVLRQIEEKQLRPICLIRQIAFDETPMELTLQARDRHELRQNMEVPIPAAIPGSAQGENKQSKSKSKQTAKIMQTDVHIAMLCEAPSSGRMVMFCMPLTSTLQAMESNTADITVPLVRESLSFPLLETCRRAFPVRIDLTATDRASANLKTDSYFRQQDADTWRLTTPCHVHMVHTVQERQLDLTKNMISGLIAFARAQQQTGSVDILREQIADVLASSVHFVRAAQPDAEDDPHAYHRENVLKFICQDSVIDKQRKVQLRYLLTGDFASKRVVSHIGAGPVPDKLCWATEVARLLLPGATPVLQRHRWMNACPSIDSAGLLANIHSLLERAVPRWIAKLRNKEIPRGDAWSDDESDEAPMDSSELPRCPNGEPDWKAWNEAQRGDARRFARSSFDGALLVARIAFEPQIVLLRGMEERSSSDWMGQVFLGWAGGGPRRPCRITDAASLRLTNKYFGDVRELMVASSRWLALAGHQNSQREASLAFCLLSRAACTTYQLIHAPNRGYPYTLFGLLDVAGTVRFAAAAEAVRSAPRCALDSFSAAFLRRFRESLASDECLALLSSVAVLQVFARFMAKQLPLPPSAYAHCYDALNNSAFIVCALFLFS